MIVGLVGGGRGVEATFEVREGRKESDLRNQSIVLQEKKKKQKVFKGSKFKATFEITTARVSTELKLKC